MGEGGFTKKRDRGSDVLRRDRKVRRAKRTLLAKSAGEAANELGGECFIADTDDQTPVIPEADKVKVRQHELEAQVAVELGAERE